MENSRDARRRRILDRGTDRLAYISGQTQSGTDSPRAVTPRPRLPPDEDYPLTPVASRSRGKQNISRFPDQYTSKKGETSKSGERAEIHQSDGVHKNQGDERASRSDDDSEPSITSNPQRSSDHVGGTSVPTLKVKNPLLFSSKQVNRAISISENKRLIFAFCVALFAIMSNQGYALGGSTGRSIVHFGPLLLIMSTNLTIILWILMTTRQGDDKETGAAKNGIEAYGWAEISFEALLIFQKVMGAIFMDCCACAAIIISGL